jgi:heparosan-N-sulfate-glucuronate 5-epimerase
LWDKKVKRMKRIAWFLLVAVLITSCIGDSLKDKVEINNEVFKPFPFTNDNIGKYKKLDFDSNHIPLLNYKDSLIYYPVQYNQVALHYYAKYYSTKSDIDKELFLRQAEFIRDEMAVHGDFGVWECNTLITPYRLETPWASSMAQGFGLGVMIQAYQLTNDELYLNAAKLALNSYEVDIVNGGIRNDWDGYVHYEEYADVNSHVLNGYIFSLGGLYYYYKNTDDKKAYKLFIEGVNSLAVKLKDYDAGFTSFYSLITQTGQYPYDSANGSRPDHYHELVVNQLITLYLWTNNMVFYEYAYRFYQQDLGLFYDYKLPNKFKGIEATYTVVPKTHGVDNLLNANWTYGNYWSTNRVPTELTLDLGEIKTDITKLVLYALSFETLPNDFEIYVYKDGKWDLANKLNDILRTHETKFQTRHHKTVVKEYDLFGNFEAEKIKIKFLSSNGEYIALRNINLLFNRREEFDNLIKLVKNQQFIYTK